MNDLRPFRFWCQKVLPLVYDDELSYYEMLCKVVDYLNKTMENVNKLSENFDELQKAFNTLKKYVDNYFKNLDVQEEINNKLDEMAKSGELTNLFAQYFIRHYNTLNDMINDTTLVSNAYCYCTGDKYNDGHYDIYRIVDRQVNNSVELKNGKYAQKIKRNIFHSNTTGIGNNGAGLAVMTNYPLVEAQVMGFKNAQETAYYKTRDGVGIFTNIRGKNPEVEIANGVDVHYDINSVTVSGANFNNVQHGDVIDTLHETPFSSLVDYAENDTIYVQGGWFEKNTGLSKTPSDNIGFKVGAITFVWNFNSSIHLYDSDETTRGAVAEYDITNDKVGGLIDGITFLTKGSQHNGTVINTIIENENTGFNYFAIINGCKTAFADNGSNTTLRKNHTDNNKYIINSANSVDNGVYNMRNDGRQNKFRGELKIIETDSDCNTNIVVAELTKDSQLNMPTDVSNDIITITNNSLFHLTLTGKFLRNTLETNYVMVSGEVVTVLSYRGAWIVLTSCNNKNGVYTFTPLVSELGTNYYVINNNLIHIHISFITSADMNKTSVYNLPSFYKYKKLSNLAYKDVTTSTIEVTETGNINCTSTGVNNVTLDIVTEII